MANKKEKLVKLINECGAKARQHTLLVGNVSELFEDVYGIAFDTNEMDFFVDIVDHGHTTISLEEMEKNILNCANSCNNDVDKNKLKNISYALVSGDENGN